MTSIVNVSVWPALGSTVTLADGITTITSAGAVLTYTSEVRSLISQGKLLTHDPQPGSTSIIDYPTQQIDTGAPLMATSLSTRSGTYQGQIVEIQYYDTGKTRGGGSFRWDGASVATVDGGTVFGNSTVGRWHRIYSGALDATWFGAVGDGVANESSALAAAAAALPSTGGTLFIPRGTYKLTGGTGGVMVPPNNSIIYGEGDLTVLRRTDTTQNAAIKLDSKSNVRVHSLRLEFMSEFTYIYGITGDDSTNIEIDHCSFAMLADTSAYGLTDNRTYHALLFRSATGLSVHHNRSYKCQFKLGGTTATSARINCSDNMFELPYDYAVSVVSQNSSAIITDVIIERNIINTLASGGGIYVGSDGETSTIGELRRVRIRDNVLGGTWPTDPGVGKCFILVHLALATTDVAITGNGMRNVNADAFDGSFGIKVDTGDPVLGVYPAVDGLVIAENQIYACDFGGIDLQLTGKNITINRNKLDQCRGIRVRAYNGDISNVVISDNTIPGARAGYGVQLANISGNLKNVICHGNVITDISGSAGGSTDTGIQVETVATYSIQAQIYGNRCGNLAGSTMDYGIRETGAGTFDCEYKDNDCRNCNTFGMSVGSTAIGRGNRGTGFVTEAGGLSSIGSGATTLTVTHGLKGVVASTIRVNATVDRSVDTDPVISCTCIDNIGTTTFRAVLSGATTTANYKLSWNARGAEYS